MSPLGLGFPTYEQGLCAANGRKLAGPPLGEQVRIAEAATRGEQDLNYLPDCWQLDLLSLLQSKDTSCAHLEGVAKSK